MTASNDRRSPAQLPLELPHRAAMGRDDFLVADSNAAAVALIDAWPGWLSATVVLVGPEGSGKSHLGEVWRARAAAEMVRACDLTVPLVPQLVGSGALLLEDAPGPDLDEAALFHLLNYIREASAHLLITSNTFPAHWPVHLKDLASRLRAATVVSLDRPDDRLLRAVLVKLFADRQLVVDEAVVDYMMLRMERSLGVARKLVDLVDRRALAGKSAITRNFVARLLAGETDDLFGED